MDPRRGAGTDRSKAWSRYRGPAPCGHLLLVPERAWTHLCQHSPEHKTWMIVLTSMSAWHDPWIGI